jgi:hypothetical protein
MTHPPYLRAKARRLRVEKRLTLDEIAERLALPKTTVWYWISDLPTPPRRATPGQALGNVAMQNKYRLLREQAYVAGHAMFPVLMAEPTFRDFVCMYIGEGFKRSRNHVALGNSDPAVIRLANKWIRRFARNPVNYRFQHHADQDPDQLRCFWAHVVGVEPDIVRVQRKSNSGQLGGRSWRSEHGVLTVRVGDTYFRAQLQAWMDRVRGEWGYTQPPLGA